MLGSLTVTDILILIGVILVSLTIHEMMHALVGFKLGDDTAAEEGRISLNPLKHIDPFMTVLLPIITIVVFQTPILAAKPVPFNPERVKWDEFGGALIAVAGPLSNLVLAVIGGLAANFVVESSLLANIVATFTIVNVSLFVFNMIPIPPLDGSRVLYAFAPDPVRRVMEQLEPVGLFLVFGLILIGGFGFVGNLIDIVVNALPGSPFIV
jgi:Zn-dependent protease